VTDCSEQGESSSSVSDPNGEDAALTHGSESDEMGGEPSKNNELPTAAEIDRFVEDPDRKILAGEKEYTEFPAIIPVQTPDFFEETSQLVLRSDALKFASWRQLKGFHSGVKKERENLLDLIHQRIEELGKVAERNQGLDNQKAANIQISQISVLEELKESIEKKDAEGDALLK